jgi:hypothetical protein
LALFPSFLKLLLLLLPPPPLPQQQGLFYHAVRVSLSVFSLSH